jgi:hypothetical protein
MVLIIGSLLISLAVLLFCVVLLAFRNPNPPFWASDMWVGNLHSIFMITLGLGGLMAIGSTLFNAEAGSYTTVELTISVVILAAMVIIVKLMRIKKRLAAFQGQR